MARVKRDSGLAPTSEVFELRVSEHRRWGFVCLLVRMKHGGNGDGVVECQTRRGSRSIGGGASPT